jgi:hypothetical protein
MTKVLPILGLNGITLVKGASKDREQGVCAMQAVAWLAGEENTDAPQCACPVIAKYVIRLNDSFTDEERQLLKPYLTRIIGTRDGKSSERAKVLVHRAGTVFAPIALEIAGYKDEAASMRALELGDYAAQKELGYAIRDKIRAKIGYGYAAAANAANAANAATAAYATATAAYAAANAAYATATAAYAADAAYAAADAAYAAYAADAAYAAYAGAADADAAAAAGKSASKVKQGRRAEIVKEALSALDATLQIRSEESSQSSVDITNQNNQPK